MKLPDIDFPVLLQVIHTFDYKETPLKEYDRGQPIYDAKRPQRLFSVSGILVYYNDSLVGNQCKFRNSSKHIETGKFKRSNY